MVHCYVAAVPEEAKCDSSSDPCRSARYERGVGGEEMRFGRHGGYEVGGRGLVIEGMLRRDGCSCGSGGSRKPYYSDMHKSG